MQGENRKTLVWAVRIAGGIGVVLMIAEAITCWIIFMPRFWVKDATLHEVRIPAGTTFPQIAETLSQESLVQSERGFKLAARILGLAGKLQAGKYEIPPGLSNYELLKILSEGKISPEWVTIPEGMDSFGIASLLARTVEIDSAQFVRLTRDSTLIAESGMEGPSLEGCLFPETYRLYWGVSPRVVIRVMVQEFKRRVADSMRVRAQELDMSFAEVVTLASIIEGEAVIDSERTLISAVYHNRLRRGMLLQADPTIQYIVPGPPRRLLNGDLEIDSPYNTYLYPGLPPGPVNNPGVESILAALYPAPVDYLYFVARGDDSHVFSRTMEEHVRAKRAFDQVRREVKRTDQGGS